MGRNGGCDFKGFEKLKVNLEVTEEQLSVFIESCAKELAARLLAKVIKRTPVGDYSGDSYTCKGGNVHKGHKVVGKVGGTLRRGWTAGKGATEYSQSLKVNHFGDTYVIEVVNPTEYASYVEFGHRTSNHKGWVNGHFMLTISEQELENAAPAILEKKIKKKLEECFK